MGPQEAGGVGRLASWAQDACCLLQVCPLWLWSECWVALASNWFARIACEFTTYTFSISRMEPLCTPCKTKVASLWQKGNVRNSDYLMTSTEEKTIDDGRRDWNDVSKAKKHQRLSTISRSQKEAKKDPPLEPLEGAWFCQHLDFGHLDFRTVREYMSDFFLSLPMCDSL